MVLAVGAGSAAFDWNQLIPGAGTTQTWASIGLQIAVGLWLVVTRRRAVERRPVRARQWALAIPTAWILCAATVLVVVTWLQHGVSW